MKVKIKKLHPDAISPTYAKEGDACVDLTAVKRHIENKYVEYETGLAVEIPKGFVGLIRPRSSISTTDLLFNTSGVIDSGYRGDLKVRFKIKRVLDNHPLIYEIGERVCQFLILPYPEIEFEEVDELSESERGTGGYGSSGK